MIAPNASHATRAIAAPYRRWCIFFLGLAVAAGGYLFYLQVRGLARYPERSAIFGWDQGFYFVWLRSPLWGGDFDFSDDIRDCPVLMNGAREWSYAIPRTEAGRIANKYGVGWAVASAPFYLAADAFVHAWRSVSPGTAPAEDGVGPPYQLFILTGQLILAVISLVLAYRILRTWFSKDVAMLGVLVTTMGSFLFFYQTLSLSMSHSTVFFALTVCYASALTFAREPGRRLPWCLCGLSAGLLVITRYQTVVYLLYPVVLAVAVAPWRSRNGANTVALERASDWWSRVLFACACFASVVFIQLFAWKCVYERWFLYSYEGEIFHFADPQWRAVLFSPRHGLFYWSPLLLLSLVGFGGWMVWGTDARWRRAEVCWIVSLLATYYLNAAWECWWFGASFGSRAFEGSVLFFMAGSAFVFEWIRRTRWRAALLGAVTLLVLGNLALANAWRRSWISPGDPVTHAQMLEAVWRYPFFSFKKSP